MSGSPTHLPCLVLLHLFSNVPGFIQFSDSFSLITFVTLSSAPRNVRARGRSRRGLFECLTGSTAAGHCLHPKGVNWKMKAHGSMIPCIKFCKKIKNSLKGQMLSYMSIKHNYGHCPKQLYHYQLRLHYHCDYQQRYHH